MENYHIYQNHTNLVCELSYYVSRNYMVLQTDLTFDIEHNQTTGVGTVYVYVSHTLQNTIYIAQGGSQEILILNISDDVSHVCWHMKADEGFRSPYLHS